MAQPTKKEADQFAEKNFDASGVDLAPLKAKNSKLKLITIILLAMLVGAGGAVAAREFFNPPQPPAIKTAEAAKTEEGAKSQRAEKLPGFPKIIEFKPFVANLNDGGQGRRYLKMTMSLEVETLAQADEVNDQMPKLRDATLMLLSSLAYEDISTLDGKIRLRAQLLNRINNQLTSGKIKEIYFAEFIVQ